MLSGTSCLVFERWSHRSIHHVLPRNESSWIIEAGSCEGTWETPGSSEHPTAFVSSGCPPLVDTTGSWSCTYREGEDYRCLYGNVSPACVRPLSSSRGSLLTSWYPQGDAARMGAPGEKGPNGLPVSMAPWWSSFQRPHLNHEEMLFPHHTDEEQCTRQDGKHLE